MLTITLIIPGRLPSWNALLAMNHWRRAKEKQKVQAEFILALSRSENACATQTILARKGLLTVSDIAAQFQEMSRTKSRSKQANAKPRKAKRNARR